MASAPAKPGVKITETVSPFHHELEKRTGGGEPDTSGWFCVALNPGLCDCGKRYAHVFETETHRIVVWPTKDDPNIGRILEDKKDEAPRVVEYERSMGACVSFYAVFAS